MSYDGRIHGPWESYSAEADVLTTTDPWGHVTRPYGRTYAALPAVTATGRNGEQVSIYHASTTTSQVTLEFRTPAGALIASGPVRFDWFAFPATK